MMTAIVDAPALFSALASDPDLNDLVEIFVSELPERVLALQAALDRADLESLGRLAHQLKGAAGSYGFAQLTPSLAQLEQSARGKESHEAIRHALASVTELCGRVRAGVPE